MNPDYLAQYNDKWETKSGLFSTISWEITANKLLP